AQSIIHVTRPNHPCTPYVYCIEAWRKKKTGFVNTRNGNKRKAQHEPRAHSHWRGGVAIKRRTNMSGNKPREIKVKLLCPSLSKVTQVVAWDHQKIDLGSICWAFGLDPSSVRLNGHFIGRGVDLVASSVTWKALLSFFSSKGLSTGKDHRDALLVTGKLCRLGLKRGHDSQDFQNGIEKVMEGENAGNSRGIKLEAANLLKNKKLKESNSDNRDKVNDHSGSIACNQFTCSYTNKNLKRIRKDEAIYDIIPLKLGARLPFTNFQCSVLKTLNIASTQLHPNGWAFVQALVILCEDSFFRVRKGDNCSDCLLDSFEETHFPLYWTSCLAV
ncbi:hypothetical protein CR513_40096, partial [Mucuna pruriens]